MGAVFDEWHSLRGWGDCSTTETCRAVSGFFYEWRLDTHYGVLCDEVSLIELVLVCYWGSDLRSKVSVLEGEI